MFIGWLVGWSVVGFGVGDWGLGLGMGMRMRWG